MGFLRKLIISFACFALFASATLLGAALATRQVLGRPAPLENALSNANVYNAIVTNFVQSNTDSSAIDVPLTIPAVQTALQKAFPQSVVEPAVNQVIAGTYAWMQGKTNTIEFRINLSGAKENLASYVQQVAEQQVAKMPTCSYSQLLTLPGIAYQNPLNVTCLPPGTTSAEVGTVAKQAILSSSFLQNPILTPSNLNISDNYKLKLPDGQSTNRIISLREAYHRLLQILYASLAISIACILEIILLHRSHLKGLGRAGATVGWAGFACLVDAVLIGEIPNWLKTSRFDVGQLANGTLQQAVVKVITILADDFHRWLLWYGIILFVVGTGLWVGVHVWLHKKATSHNRP